MTEIGGKGNPEAPRGMVARSTFVRTALATYVLFVPALTGTLYLSGWLTEKQANLSNIYSRLQLFVAIPAMVAFASLAVHVARLRYYRSPRRCLVTGAVGGAIIGLGLAGIAGVSLGWLLQSRAWWLPHLLLAMLTGALFGFTIDRVDARASRPLSRRAR